MTSTVQRAAVGIVGGGPVGLMLALFLDRHGVPCVLFNLDETTRWHPKGGTQNSRTMEHYRRLGIAERIRGLGLPADHPTDVGYFTRFNGRELARVIMQSTREKLRGVAAAPSNHQNFEPIHRANQMYVERALFEHARTRPNITLRFGWQAGKFTEDADGVTLEAARVVDETSKTEADFFEHAVRAVGPEETWRLQYLVGCDGGHSHVRRTLGIRYGGHENLNQSLFGGATMSTYIRAPSLARDCFEGRRGFQYWALNPQVRMLMVALDGRDEYTFYTPVPEGSTFDERLAMQAFHRACGHEAPVEVLGNRKWTAGVAVWADRFGSGHRIFLAGDAIHLFTPTGGFGFNTGIDGAANLAWKLAALVQGWGGPRLGASYETERRPIAARNTTAARRFAQTVGRIEVRSAIDDEGPAGEEARRVAAANLDRSGEEFASLGVQLGVRYDGSPIVFEDGTPPVDSVNCYTPSGVPGGRAPHFFLDPPGMAARRSLFDCFGVGFTLLRFDAKADVASLVDAARRRGMPLEVVDVFDPDARELYGRDMALVRPDQHVAWRGDAAGDAPGIVARVVGD